MCLSVVPTGAFALKTQSVRDSGTLTFIEAKACQNSILASVESIVFSKQKMKGVYVITKQFCVVPIILSMTCWCNGLLGL